MLTPSPCRRGFVSRPNARAARVAYGASELREGNSRQSGSKALRSVAAEHRANSAKTDPEIELSATRRGSGHSLRLDDILDAASEPIGCLRWIVVDGALHEDVARD